ncbi:hypothetical protein C0992_001644 [Termitomyces sp. T32_za158]|nr:hypothetical protein C0992_001644 [Termitomyces sp. T32_za158]
MDFAQPEHITAGQYYDERAAKLSALIDEELKREYARRKDAARREIKVMLLGQAESGKSTLQKQFQLYYASQTLDHERPSWRPVVYFNVLKALRMTLDELDYEFTSQSQSQSRQAEDPNAITEIPIASSSLPPPVLSTDLLATQREIGELRAQLLPVVALEDTLASDLSGGVSVSGGRTGAYVRAGWQGLVTSAWALGDSRSAAPPRGRRSEESVQLAAKTLASTSEPIKALWAHRAVKRLLDAKKLRLEESAPFFLNNIDRIAEPDFLPTNDDILNVRLQTLGVMEHTFPINMGGVTYDWKLYDVGGARGQADLLKKKLAAGIKVRKYITSYGDRPNVYENVSDYFRSHFMQVHRRKDLAKRSLYVHFTSMLDIKATQSIIANVGEVILRQHIEQIGLA